MKLSLFFHSERYSIKYRGNQSVKTDGFSLKLVNEISLPENHTGQHELIQTYILQIAHKGI